MRSGGYLPISPTPKGESAGEAFFIGGNMLTQERLKELLIYDETTGLFTRKKDGKIAGSNHGGGYIHIKIENTQYLAHRLAWLYVYGEFPKLNIDHKDHDRKNNRLENLRDVSNTYNAQNIICAKKNNKKGLLGAHLDKKSGRFCARISVDRKTIHLGTYDTKEEAHQVYVAAKRILHPGGLL